MTLSNHNLSLYSGQLTAECRGPSGNSVPIAVEPTSGSRVRLLLTPRTPGEHVVYLQYGGFSLPHSPVLGVADGGSGASSGPVRVVLTGRGLAGAKCHDEAEFTIDGSQAGPGTCFNYNITVAKNVRKNGRVRHLPDISDPHRHVSGTAVSQHKG